MDHTYFVSINRELCLIEEHAGWAGRVLDELRLYKTEFRFLERFFGLYANKDNEDAIMNEETRTIRQMKDRFRGIWVKEGNELSFRFSQVRNGYTSDWDALIQYLKPNLHDSKLVVKEWCEFVTPLSKKSNPDEILILIDTIVDNLKDLRGYKVNKDVHDRFETLEERLLFMQNFWKLIVRCMQYSDYQEFERRAHISINNAACQTFLMWVKGVNEDDAFETDLIITEILFMTENCMPDAIAPNYSALRYKGLSSGDIFRYIEATTSDEIIRYIDEILTSLKHIVNYKASEISPLMKQIESLEQKLVFLQNFLKLAANCKDSLEFQKFKIYVCELSKNAAWLTILYYIKAGDEEILTEMSHMLSDILQKMECCTPDVIAIYFGTIKGMKLQRSDTLLLGQTVVDFVDFLFENIVSAPFKDGFQILHEGLIFVLTFLADPPIENANDDKLRLVLRQIDGLLKGVMHLSSYDMNYDGNLRISQRDIEKVTAQIRQFYCKFQYSSSYNFPKIIGQGFLDFLIRHLGNLKENHIKDDNYLPFAKKTIRQIEEEVVSLRSYFNDIMDMQKNKELNDTWLQAIHLAYVTEQVVNSCLSLDFQIWYHMAHLHDVLNKIKVVKTKLQKIKESNVYNVGVLPYSASSNNIVSEQVGATCINQVVVGFEKEVSTIIENLTCEHKPLDIVSIVGMPGSGKTTLARKVYNDPLVTNHFYLSAFCSVSRDHNAMRLLHDILSKFNVTIDVSSITKEDLVLALKQKLSGQKYLIVLDDIWDISAWNEVDGAFPDHENGSRVVFTTRFKNVAKDARKNCSPCHLGILSDEESWELLQKKVSNIEIYLLEYSIIGKQIAEKCKGLPLAIVVIAGLLKREKPSIEWWTEIADQIGSFLLDDEGYMDMLEFSYKHLPEYLKPILLYFGAFPEDALISVKRLMLLWIAEGFAHESDTKTLEDVAKDYLHDLIDRSLIMVTGTSSNGGVKTVCIHDLIHDFCRIKARAENFFQCRFGIASSSSSHNPIYNRYRICMPMDSETTVDDAPTFPYVHSLLYFHGCNDPYDTLHVFGKFKLVQVLNLDNKWLEQYDINHMTLLVNLRHIVALVKHSGSDDILVPSSISNLWTLETFILRAMSKGDIQLPKTIWNLKWLKHVNISRCKLIFPSGQHEHESYSQLNNVESFSSLTLTTGNDLEDLLQRLPGIRKLSCSFDKSCDFGDKQVETLDFLGQLETLNLSYIGYRSPYVIKFASTLKKLKLVGFKLPWTAISVIEKLEHLEILKLLWNSFVGPRWEMEDVIFPSLKFLKLNSLNLVHWKALPDSFPCLEQLLVLGCEDLVEIPACFGEISSLKRFEVHDCNKKALISATQVKNDQMDYGNDTLEVAITNSY